VKFTVLIVFCFGAAISILSWMFYGVSGRLFLIGLFFLFISYIIFIIYLYVNKVNVHSRGGFINFKNSPLAYRFYFIILVIPWIIANIIILSKYLSY